MLRKQIFGLRRSPFQVLTKARINFCDFWPGFDPENNFLLRNAPQCLSYEISDNPDYVFCSVYGKQHITFSDCIKILYTGENTVPDFNLYDYGIGFHYLEFADRYLRFPLAFANPLVETLETSRSITPSLAERKFCNFIYGNSRQCDPLREKFFLQLSKYRAIDSGGKVRNNIGRIIQYPQKLDFLRNYKFTIAFENSSVDGYVTEKLVDAFLAQTIPIYFGSPSVTLDFHADSYIAVEGEHDFPAAIDSIKRLDNNASTYLAALSKPSVYKGRTRAYEQKLSRFLENIFKQSLNLARRRPKYGGILNCTTLYPTETPIGGSNKIWSRTYNQIREAVYRKLKANRLV